MYSTKFFWKCPNCTALNSYCVDYNKDTVQHFNSKSSSNSLIAQRRCHYCLSDLCLLVGSNSIVHSIASEDRLCWYPFKVACGGKFYDSIENDFIFAHGLLPANTSLRDKDAYVIPISSLEELNINRAFANVSDTLSNVQKYSFGRLRICVKNVLEYNSLLKIILNYCKFKKYPYRCEADMQALPFLFDAYDVAIKLRGPKAWDRYIQIEAEKIGLDAAEFEYYIPYAAVVSFPDTLRGVIDKLTEL